MSTKVVQSPASTVDLPAGYRLANRGKNGVPNATEKVYEALHAALVTLDLPPGTKVSETEVARQMDVSRQPVRDAFFRLSKLGFLEIRPQRATFITKISVAAVRQAAFIRTSLEAACIRAATERATATDLARLEENLDRQEAAVAANDRTRFHNLDDEFHELICEISGHGYVWPLIDDYKAHMDRARYLSLTTGTKLAYAQHRELLAAITAGDTATVDICLRQHLGRIEEILIEVRREYAQYFDETE